jgi:hypothetical protein
MNLIPLDRERRDWEKRRRAEHVKFVKQFSFHTSKTFMDYLHNDVNPEEASVVCLYEYYRESKEIREAAKRCDQFILESPPSLSAEQRPAWERMPLKTRVEKAALLAVEEMRLDPRIRMTLIELLKCESFPQKDWQELKSDERKLIMRFRRTEKFPPLHMQDAWMLRSLGILKKFDKLSEKARPVVEDVPPGSKPPPMKLLHPILRQNQSLFNVIFTLDFSERETCLVERFRTWLQLPVIQKRLTRYKKLRSESRAKALDRLKDLAAWRLYREFNNDWNAANNFANKHRKEGKPFRDAKRQGDTPAAKADLFREDADARKASASAWKYLVELLPGEFAFPQSTSSWFRALDDLA